MQPRTGDRRSDLSQLVGQERDSDHAPFLLHPLEVAALLHNSGHPEPVVAAGILHDTVEDTPAAPRDIRERFGDEVAGVVEAVTEDRRSSRCASVRRRCAARSRRRPGRR